VKLSEYAKKTGISYQTAWRMWKRGQLNAYQLFTGTVVVKIEDEPTSVDLIACIYARVSSAENKKNLKAQAQRLTNYAIARGYRIYKVVKEVGTRNSQFSRQ
jgi:predicted site-specific integrase-resolvase